MSQFIKDKMERTGYPSGYKEDFPDPMADIEALTDMYVHEIKWLKRYALTYTIMNSEKSLEAKKAQLETETDEKIKEKTGKTVKWLEGKIKEYREEFIKLVGKTYEEYIEEKGLNKHNERS